MTDSPLSHIIAQYFRAIKRIMNKISQFLKEVKQEIKKVTWPTRAETFRYSLMVIIASLVVAMYLGGLDYVVANILEMFIR